MLITIKTFEYKFQLYGRQIWGQSFFMETIYNTSLSHSDQHSTAHNDKPTHRTSIVEDTKEGKLQVLQNMFSKIAKGCDQYLQCSFKGIFLNALTELKKQLAQFFEITKMPD